MLSVILPSYNEEQMIAVAASTVSGILDEAGIEHELKKRGTQRARFSAGLQHKPDGCRSQCE